MSARTAGCQSRAGSAVESAVNIGSGYVLSWMLWRYVAAPMFEIETSAAEQHGICLLFTALSLVRSYLWPILRGRRASFNREGV